MSLVRIILPFLCLLSLPALAVCTSTTCQQGTTSSGSIVITLQPDEKVRLWGLSNMEMGDPAGGIYQSVMGFCAFSSTGSGQITMSSQNNMFLKGPSGQQGSYQLWISPSSSNSWINLGSGDSVIVNLSNIQPSQTCSGQSNMNLKTQANARSFQGFTNGAYTDIVILTLSPL